jgi:regulator of replication initiation timing
MDELVLFLLFAGTYIAYWIMFTDWKDMRHGYLHVLACNDRLRLENEDLRKQLQAYKANPIIADLRAALH